MAVPPLNQHVRITGDGGRPTPEFIRLWQTQLQANGEVVPLSTPAQVSAVIDLLSSTRGALLVRGETRWEGLNPGPEGYALASGGPGESPVWVTLAKAFTGLTDTPVNYEGAAGQAVLVNATEDGLEFGDVAQSFITLTDAPSSYAGQAGLVVKVNVAESGLEFGEGGGGDVNYLLAIQTYQNSDYETFSTSAYATKGNTFEALNDGLPIIAVRGLLDTGQTVKLVIAAVTTSSPYTITAILYESDPVVIASAVLETRFVLPEPVTVDTGDHVAIMFVRTDGTTTSILEAPFNSANVVPDGNGNFDGVAAIRYASVDPAVSDDTFFAGDTRVRMTIESIDPALYNLLAFLALSDTPASYTGQAGKFVRVNPGETGLEFGEGGGGAGSITIVEETAAFDITDTQLSGLYVVECNFAGPAEVTVPAGLTGTEPVEIVWTGTAQLAIVPASGVSILVPDDATHLRTRGSWAKLTPRGADSYLLWGDMDFDNEYRILEGDAAGFRILEGDETGYRLLEGT